MSEYLEFTSPVQPTVQRVDGVPTLERHEQGLNLCINSDFTSNNDTDGAIYSGEVRNTEWKMYSPVFVSAVDYKQGFNFQYILPYQPYENTTSLVETPADWQQIPLSQHRGVRMFGLGDDFGLAINQDSDRTFAETPIVGLHKATTTISSSTPWRDPSTWVKYDRYQTIRTTADTITFVAWVKCDPNDALRELNMGGLYLWQDTSSSSSGPRTIKVDAMVIKRAANTPNLHTGTLSTGQGHYHFGGMNHLEGEDTWSRSNENKYRWNDYLTVNGIDYYDSEDLATWTRIEKTVTLPGASGSLRRLGFAMFFAENCSYLTNDGTLTGSVDFYYPYVLPVSAETETSVSTATGGIGGAGGASITHNPSQPFTNPLAGNRNLIPVTFYINLDPGKILNYMNVTGLGREGPVNLLASVNYNNLNGRKEISSTTVQFQGFEGSAPFDPRLKGGASGSSTTCTLYVARGATGTATISLNTIDE